MNDVNLYTSYFANIKNLLENVEPIAICGKFPENYSGKQYRKLAPSWSIWKEWHDSTDPDKDERYTERFFLERLSPLDAEKVFKEISELADEKIPCLICYERPENFCHRHLVARWFEDILGLYVKEYGQKV